MKNLLWLCLGLLAVPPVKADDFDSAATSVNQLGLELLLQMTGPKAAGNLLLSPYSIQTALAMTYAGADGATRTEMARVLHYPADENQLRASLDSLRAGLDRTVENSVRDAASRMRSGGSAEPIELHVANRLYGQTGYAFREDFLALLKDGYKAPLESFGFRTDPELARLKINGWVEEQTRTRIRNLIPPLGIEKDTRLVLVNSLYVKASWSTPFQSSGTQDRPFLVGGTQGIMVPTMQQQANVGYATREGFTVLTLPYVGNSLIGGTLQFLIILPDEPTGLAEVVRTLTPRILAEAAAAPLSRNALVELPRFRVAGETVDLGLALRALGLGSPFDLPKGSANFDRMAPRRPDDYLFISHVFHKTFVAVDEAGTEAAAATAVVIGRGGGFSTNPREVRVDHPFLFAIQHRESGACLFLGFVNDPR